MRFKDIDNSLDLIKYEDQCIQEDIIYVKPGIYAMSSRKIDSLIKINEGIFTKILPMQSSSLYKYFLQH